MMSRRTLLKTTGIASLHAATSPVPASVLTPPTLPDRHNFRAQDFETCLNAGRWHPLSNGARAAVDRYHEYKQRGIWDRTGLDIPQDPTMHGGSQQRAKTLFAQLINASPDEIAFVQSTTAGENLVVQSLNLPTPGKNIVTDGLHFEGSLYLYDTLRRQGSDVRFVRPHGWRIDMADLERAIDSNTRLVAISAISYINGFEHDLKAICDHAHSRGALVYVDLVQAAGAMPVDVRQSGVDFAACASYKWLMGDFGLGFLYVRKDLLAKIVVPPVHSYRQWSAFTTHMLPDDPPATPGAPLVEWTRTPNAAGAFEQGTLPNAITETLAYSLDYIQTLGVANIQKHSQSLTGRLRRELPPLGYPCITPAESHGPLIAFALKDPAATAQTLKAARVDVTISASRMRVSPSVYNNEEDIDRLIQALKS